MTFSSSSATASTNNTTQDDNQETASSPTMTLPIPSPPPSCCGDAVAMIRIRRDNLRPHLDEEIEWWIQAYTRPDNSIPDYQMAAWLMAVCFHPLTPREIATLTRCMVQSGRSLDWSSYLSSSTSSSHGTSHSSRVLVDKHSTGGVGDKVTILLAPLVACLGVKVPSIAGRGLGHSGGTIDKLEAIPGWNGTSLSLTEFQRIVAGGSRDGGVGCCIIAAGPDLCPADRKLYSLRDVTGTVRSIGLQTASIMCKKIAEHPHSIVLDCKYGLGAFQPTLEEAAELATCMIDTGLANGLCPSSTAFLTRMDQPLGCAVGNWLEILECLQIMSGKLPMRLKPMQTVSSSAASATLPILASIETSADLISLVCIQAGQMLLQSGLYPHQSLDELTEMAFDTLMEEGKVLNKFKDMCRMQGGDVSVIDNAVMATTATSIAMQPDESTGCRENVKNESSSSVSSLLFPPHLAPSHCHVIRADGRGVVTEINAMTIGLLAVNLGAGRKTAQDKLHLGTGFWFHVKVGHVVQENDILVQVFSDGPLPNQNGDDDDDDDEKSTAGIETDSPGGGNCLSTAATTSLLQRVKECIVIAPIENDTDAFGRDLVQQPIVTHRVTSQDGMQEMGPLPAKLKQFLYGSSLTSS